MMEDSSGLYEASGLKDAFEKIEKEMEEEKKKQESGFWKDIENEKPIFEEPEELINEPIKKDEPKEEDDIDPFWLS